MKIISARVLDGRVIAITIDQPAGPVVRFVTLTADGTLADTDVQIDA